MTTEREPDWEALEAEQDARHARQEASAARDCVRVRSWPARTHPKGCHIAFIGYTAKGTAIARECGDLDSWGTAALCPACDGLVRKQYPQGWRHNPGDTCEHGRYLGESGPDLMCPTCEAAS